VDRIVAEASLSPGANGDLAAAAERIMPALPVKARAGVCAFLQALEGGGSLLAPEGAVAPEGADQPAADDPPAGEKAAGDKRRRGKKREELSAGEGLSACAVRLIVDSGIGEYHLTHDDITGNQRLGNLQELANAASLYPATRAGLLEFLEHIELDRSIEKAGKDEGEEGMVTLITLHNTKGLEFRRVIITGVEQGVFPRDDKKDGDLEEERRLFYVGATRAMDELYLTSCAERRMFGRTMPMEPSLFLAEADKKSLRVIGRPPRSFKNDEQGMPFREPPAKAGKSVQSSDGRWKVGDRVFHDNYGYGAVMEIRESAEGPVIRLQFETGKECRFLSLHQSAQYTKIGNDD
jgi:DNA helicase-2/ATP-dependent DNA helicase PcrA